MKELFHAYFFITTILLFNIFLISTRKQTSESGKAVSKYFVVKNFYDTQHHKNRPTWRTVDFCMFLN